MWARKTAVTAGYRRTFYIRRRERRGAGLRTVVSRRRQQFVVTSDGVLPTTSGTADRESCLAGLSTGKQSSWVRRHFAKAGHRYDIISTPRLPWFPSSSWRRHPVVVGKELLHQHALETTGASVVLGLDVVLVRAFAVALVPPSHFLSFSFYFLSVSDGDGGGDESDETKDRRRREAIPTSRALLREWPQSFTLAGGRGRYTRRWWR